MSNSRPAITTNQSAGSESGFAKHMKRGQKLARSGRLGDAIECFEAALTVRPDDPSALFALGNVARRLDMNDVAARMFRLVLQAEPDSIEAANNLGNVCRDLGRYDEAIEVLRTAITLAPDRPEVWTSLGTVMMQQGDLDNARTFYEEALRLRPGYGEALANVAEVHSHLGQYDEALRYFRRVLKRFKQNAQLHVNYSQTLMAMGRLAEAWPEYEYRLKSDIPNAVDYRHGLPRWRGEDLAGRTILVSGEQGVGDQILLASCLGELIDAAKHVVIEIEPRLVPLLRRSFPSATVVPYQAETTEGRVRFHYDWLKEIGPVDVAVPIASLLGAFRGSWEAFPSDSIAYLKPDPDGQIAWQARLAALGPDPKIGICWRSGNLAAHRLGAYTRLEDWGDILTSPGVTFVNVQYGECRAELDAARSKWGVEIHDFTDLDHQNDLDGAAALTAGLDLVLTAPTAVCAMAGALAVPTIMIGWGWFTFGTERWPLHPSVSPVWGKQREPSLEATATAFRHSLAAILAT